MFICDSWCNCSWNDMPLFISSSYFIIHILYFTAVLHDSLEKDIMLFLLKCAIRHNKEIDNYNILILPLPNPSVTLSLSFTIYCPSASSSKYPGPGPLSGLTPLAHWNLSRNQNWGISELSMTLAATRIRLATSTLDPCQYQDKTISGVSCKSVDVQRRLLMEKLGHTSGDGLYLIDWHHLS